MPPLQFITLHDRLIARLRKRVQSGETTERSLARLTGISQPHVHNVLKGNRLLSTDLADTVLQRLRLSVLDLLEPQEIESLLAQNLSPEPSVLPIAVLEGCLGPGYPLPWAEPEGPLVAVRLASDPEMGSLLTSDDFAVIDRTLAVREEPVPGSLYVIRTGEGPRVRWLRREEGGLMAVTAPAEGCPEAQEIAGYEGRNLPDSVLAHVVRITRRQPRDERDGVPE